MSTLRIDWTRCTGHGICAELLPERIRMDEWGYPLIDATPIRGEAERHARRAVSACPALALALEEGGERPPRR